jgi:hypothetical protein
MWKTAFTVALVVTILTGCTNESQIEAQPDAEETGDANQEVLEDRDTIQVEISVIAEGEEIESSPKTLELDKGDNLLEVMKNNFEIEETDTFIQSIDGYEQKAEDGMYWLFDINGEMAPAGANEIELQEGDFVEWKLESIS